MTFIKENPSESEVAMSDSLSPSLTLWSWPTTSGHRVHIGLEEMQLRYTLVPVNLQLSVQHSEDFRALNPNSRIPVLRYSCGIPAEEVVLHESCAILMYLAEKYRQFLPATGKERFRVIEALTFQAATVGPALGSAHHYRCYASERVPYAIERTTKEAQRLYSVMDSTLRRHRYLGGDEYSIADMAAFPWIRHWRRQGVFLHHMPNLFDWYQRVRRRTGVQRGISVLSQYEKLIPFPANPPTPLLED